MPFRLAHISDLHVGKDAEHTSAAARLARGLFAVSPDWIALTGDVTETGLMSEKKQFDTLFGGLRRRMTLVPGNHDRCGDGVARFWVRHPAGIWVERPPESEVSFVCLDSTQPMNNVKFMASGHLDDRVRKGAIGAVKSETSFDRTPIVLLHHHLLPLPPDGPLEFFAEWGDLPFLEAVDRGRGFVDALGVAGARLVLHGHKHKPAQTDRPGVSVVNAGSTTELGSFRVFEIESGQLTSSQWYRF